MTWDTNKIISFGLVVMGIIAVAGWLAISWKTGTSTGTEIPIGIISGLVGVLTGKGMAERAQQSKTAETLGKVAQGAEGVKTIVQAVEATKQSPISKRKSWLKAKGLWPTAETLGKVAQTAEEAQKIVQGLESLKDLGKK